MVSVAQLAERWTVAPVVEGSNPFAHPTLCARSSARIERQTPDLKVPRSNRGGRTTRVQGFGT